MTVGLTRHTLVGEAMAGLALLVLTTITTIADGTLDNALTKGLALTHLSTATLAVSAAGLIANSVV